MFLAKKVRFHQQSFSSTVVKIGTISVAIGISTLIIALAVLFGFKNTIKDKLFSLNGHIQVSKITLNHSFDEIPFKRNIKTEEILSRIPTFDSYYPIINKAGILKSSSEINGVLLKGVDSSFANSPFTSSLVAGRWISKSNPNEIIISKKIANKLAISLNESILIYFVQNPPRARKFKVVGIYDTGIAEFDNSLVYTSAEILQKMNNWETNEIGHYEIFIDNFDQLQPAVNHLEANLPNDFSYSSLVDIVPQFFDWFNLLDRNILIVIILIILVAAFNMISVLLIMLMERTPMIGILKALGMQNQAIRSIFMLNGLMIIAKGMLWGNSIGLAFCFAQKYLKFIPLDPENYYMSYIPIELNWWAILTVNLLVALLVSITLLLPTYLIFRISPVKALKFKD